MKIKPISDHVVVEPIKKEEKTKSGILIPISGEEEAERGRVLAVGPGKLGRDGKLTPMQVKEGDIVLLAKYSQDKVRVEGKEYFITTQDKILGTLEE
ncbi:MAG: co-chaperone GroES [bacterium]|nr:co-chaperone GroES [bacterium]MDZ4231922.1 co-chaperone GroES [Candidatus Pacearchaeota archaeon]